MSQPPPAATSAGAEHGDATRAGTSRRWRRLALVLAVPVGFAAGFGSMAGALALNTSPDEPPPTAITSSTPDATASATPSVSTPPGKRIAAADVVLGTCFSGDPLGESIESMLYEVPCSQPHTAETIDVHLFEDGPYPGWEVVKKTVGEACGVSLQRLPKQEHIVNRSTIEVLNWPPSAATWGLGDRISLCTVSMKDSSMLVGSFLDGSARQL